MKTNRILACIGVAALSLTVGGLGYIASAAPPYTFSQPINSFTTTTASSHSAGANTLVLQAGDGARLGTLGANRAYRVVATSGTAILSVLQATGKSTDTLTGVSAVEGTTNVSLSSGTAISVRITAGYVSELQDAVDDLARIQGYTINVLAGGTVTGDGETDDAPAIQALIDANIGKRIYFPRTDPANGHTYSYYCGSTIEITGQGTRLEGETPVYGVGTVLKFAVATSGIWVHPGSQGTSIANICLLGRNPWTQGYLTQGIPPSGWTGDAVVDALVPSDDGFRIGSDLCVLSDCSAFNFGRHGFSLANSDTGGTSDTCNLTNCFSGQNRGYGYYLQGADANAGTYVRCVATGNQLGGIYDLSFLGNTWIAPKTDENHFDNTGPVAGEAIASIVRTSNVVTLTFVAPYSFSDLGGTAFVVGQGVTVAGMTDATYNGTWIVREVVSPTVIKYGMTGSNATPTVPMGATAGIAQQRDTWARAGLSSNAGGSLIVEPGAIRTYSTGTHRSVIINAYNEDSQNPTGTAGLPNAALGSGTTAIGGIGAIYDIEYATPAIYTIIEGASIGSPGFTGSFPSVYIPKDTAAPYVERVGKTANQDSVRRRLSVDGSTLWCAKEGPTYKVLYSGDPATADPATIAVQYIDRATRNVTYDRGLKAGHGPTADRPAGLGPSNAGMMFWDTDLSKPIWWNGTVWKDAAGSTVLRAEAGPRFSLDARPDRLAA